MLKSVHSYSKIQFMKMLLPFLQFRSCIIFYIILSFFCFNVANAQIASVTANKNFLMSNTGFLNFEVPTSTAAVTIGTTSLQAIVATTPSPGLYWDDHLLPTPHRGSLLITASSFPVVPAASITNILLDDIILTKPTGSNAAVAIIACRVMDNNNRTHIILLLAPWNATGFTFSIIPATTEIDLRLNSNPVNWLDRASISSHENGAEPTNKQEVFVTWQENNSIWVSEGYISFSSNALTWYNAKKNVFPTGAGVPAGSTFMHPDITTKTSSYKTIVAIRTTATQKSLIGFDYQNAISNPDFIFSNASGFQTLYTITSTTENLRTPRVEKLLKQAYLTAINKLDITNKRSSIVIAGSNISSQLITPVIANSVLESICSNNYNYDVTGSPSIALIDNANNFEIAWQQVECGSVTNNCTVNAISKRYTLPNSGTVLTPNTPTSGIDNYFYLNTQLSVNSLFPSIASLRLTNCINFYSFGIMNKSSSSNGIIVNKKSTCNSSAVRTAYSKGIVNNPPDYVSLKHIGKSGATTQISVYPNPANKFIKVNLPQMVKEATINLYNNTGEMLKTLQSGGNSVIELNISELTPGNYYLKIVTDKGAVLAQRIVILHP